MRRLVQRGPFRRLAEFLRRAILTKRPYFQELSFTRGHKYTHIHTHIHAYAVSLEVWCDLGGGRAGGPVTSPPSRLAGECDLTRDAPGPAGRLRPPLKQTRQ